MASSANHFSLFFLLTLLSSLHAHARDVQFFNKVSNNVIPSNKQPQTNQQEEPNFLPETENGYGLYGHEAGQLPPSTATTTATKQPVHKYLPKNYNPVAYVTVPESINTEEETSLLSHENNNNYYNGEQNYYNNQQEEESQYRRYPTTTPNTRNYHNGGGGGGGGSFNSQPQGLSDTRFSVGGAVLRSREKYFNNGGEANGFQPQGMSDTRYLENGKYFYDVNTEKYSINHPYESLRSSRARNEYNNRNYYGNTENAYEFNGEENSMGGYQNQGEFQDEENYNLP